MFEKICKDAEKYTPYNLYNAKEVLIFNAADNKAVL
jgi:hypothetical protein